MIDSENKAYIDARINTLRNMINDLWNQIRRIDIELDSLKDSFNCIQNNAQDVGTVFKKFTELDRPEADDISRHPEQKDDLEIFNGIEWNNEFF